MERRRGGSSALDGVEEVDESSRIGVSVRASVPVSDTVIGITFVPSGDEGVKTEGFSSVEVTSSSVGVTSPEGSGVEWTPLFHVHQEGVHEGMWVSFEELNLLHQGFRLMSSNMSLEENSPWCHKPSRNRPANSKPPSEAEHPLMGSCVCSSTEQ